MKTIMLVSILVIASVCHAGKPLSCINEYIEESLRDNIAITTKVFPEYITERFDSADKVCFSFQKGDMYDVKAADIEEPIRNQNSNNYYGLSGPQGYNNNYYYSPYAQPPQPTSRYGEYTIRLGGDGRAGVERVIKPEAKEKYLIEDRQTKLSIWMSKEQLDFVGKQAKLKDSLFKGHAFADKCIPYRASLPFEIKEAKRTSKGFEVLIQSQTGLQMWVPSTELKLEQTYYLQRKCPEQKAEKPSSKTAT